MRRKGGVDPEYFDFLETTFHVGEARSGLLDSLTAAEKKTLKAKEQAKVIGFAIPNEQNEERSVPQQRSASKGRKTEKG